MIISGMGKRVGETRCGDDFRSPASGARALGAVRYVHGNITRATARVSEGSGSEARQTWRPRLSGALKNLGEQARSSALEGGG